MKLSRLIPVFICSALSMPNTYAKDSITLHFDNALSQVEQCLLDTFVAEAPIPVSYVEVIGDLRYAVDWQGREIEKVITLQLMINDDTFHPSVLNLVFTAGRGEEWRRISSGGKPYFVADRMKQRVVVEDHVSGEPAFEFRQSCIAKD